jgi:acetyl-CoA/propionyl-CoA carboxylase biotin carboxyl carrier protein
MTVPQAFDSLVAKLIVTGATRAAALARARRALGEFSVGGMPTVLPFHRLVVADPAFAGPSLGVHTRWIEEEWVNPLAPYDADAAGGEAPARERITVEVGGKRLEVVVPAALLAAGPAAGNSPERVRGGARRARGGSTAPAAGGDALVSPMQGTIIKIVALEGQVVSAGDTVVVLEAMKMEQPLTAHKDGTVTGMAVEVGQTVTAQTVICRLES